MVSEAGDSVEPDPMIGQVIADRFKIISLMGAGGMGTVYEAQHTFIDKRVALKLLHSDVTANPEAMVRFQREAMAASTIGHENIVQIDDCGRLADGQIYLTMEYLEGAALNDLLAQRQLPIREVLEFAIQTCHGLAAAHSKGIIHRDMKPENIFWVEELARVKILDFGIAKIIRSDSETNLTKTGTIFGTPNYMAPEQALGKAIDHRVDIYAMGVILFEMVTGQLPFRSDSFVAILTQHVTEPPPSPKEIAGEREVPQELERIILRTLAKDPADRYQSMGELVTVLTALHGEITDGAPLDAHLRLSKISPPSHARETEPQSTPAKVTATAGELMPTPTPKRRYYGVTVVAAVLLAGAIAVFLFLRPTPPAQLASANTAAVRDQQPLPALPPDATPAPRSVQILIETIPSGAAIERDGEQIGEAPDMIAAPEGHKVTLILRLAGHQSRVLEFTATDGMKQKVTMKSDPLPRPKIERTRSKRVRRARPKRRPRGRADRKATPNSPHSDHDDHSSDQEPRDSHGSSHDEVINPY